MLFSVKINLLVRGKNIRSEVRIRKVLYFVTLVAASVLSVQVGSAMSTIQPSSEYIEMIKRANGVSDEFVTVIKIEDTKAKVASLIDYYDEILVEAQRKEVDFLGLVRTEANAAIKQQKEAELHSVRLRWYRAREEMMALLLETCLSKETGAALRVNADVVSILRGSMTSDEMKQKLKVMFGIS